MKASAEQAAEAKHLKACINDLIGIVAMTAAWSGGDPARIVSTLLDVLQDMLRLDFAYARLRDPAGGAPIEMHLVASSGAPAVGLEEVGQALNCWMGEDPRQWPSLARNTIGGADMSIASLQLGLRGEAGVVVAGSQRADFPLPTEKLLLNVAANQAVIGLDEARRLSEQKRVADELDRLVAQRTAELAAANEGLEKEIAERKLVEKRLREEEQELKRKEALLAQAQRLSLTGSFAWRLATDEITWSLETHRIYEVDPAERVTIELIATRIHPEDIPLFSEMITRARSDGSDLDYEYRLQMPDKSVKHMHLVARATRDEDGQLEYIGAIQDVTERWLAQEAFGKIQAELAHVARLTTMGELAASIIHEINQPLAAVVINADAGVRWLDRKPPEVDKARATFSRIAMDGARAGDVIKGLRALAKRTGPDLRKFDINEAIRQVLGLAGGALWQHNVALRTELLGGEQPILGDRVQAQQVLLNLIMNGIESMSAVADRPRVLTISSQPAENGAILVAVADTGAGIDPAITGRIFDALFTTKAGGMGMGLSICRSIVEAHGGRIWVSPHQPHGSVFQFTLPSTAAEG